jgi:drug/metabolite transporter (DMT)-like permease
MLWLVAAVFLDFGYIQLFKLGQRRGCAAPVVVSLNYLTIGIVLGLYLLVCGSWFVSPAALVTGISSGAVFLASMLAFNHALHLLPVGPVLTAFRLSLLAPLALGIWLWHEPLSFRQLGGLGLAAIALTLMSAGPGANSALPARKIFGLLAAVFLLQGLCTTAIRSVHYQGLDAYILPYIVLAGLTAGALGFATIRLRRLTFTLPSVRLGLGLGLYNALALPIVMTALGHWPGTIYFPVTGCGALILDNLCAHYFWREKLTPLAIAGAILAALALVLIIH